MSFPENITRTHLLDAIKRIDIEGIPAGAHSSTYDVLYNEKRYPPKLVVSYANKNANGTELDRNSFEGGLNTPAFNLLEKEGFKIVEKEKRNLSSQAWLLTWNPEKISDGGMGTENSGLDFTLGEPVSWNCNSKQPKIGDIAYLLKQGVEPKGIIAKCRVVKESYEAVNWQDENKTQSYIDVVIDEYRPDCKTGLLPLLILENALGEQHWNSRTSGIEIKGNISSKLDNFWEKGRGLTSLRQFVDWSSNDLKHRRSDWLKHYIDTTTKINELKKGVRNLDDEMLSLIWKKDGNGISHVAPGFLSNEDYSNNIEFLTRLTKKILSAPLSETGRLILNEWENEKNNGQMRQVYKSVIHRVFSGAAPEKYTTLLNEGKCKKLLIILEKNFQIKNSRTGDWFDLNLEIKRCMSEAGLLDERVLENNIAMWELYDLSEGEGSINTILPRIWYVYQGTSYSPERGMKYLWAPSENQNGTELAHWKSMKELKIGDFVVHHANGGVRAISKVITNPRVEDNPFKETEWSKKGRLADVMIIKEFKEIISSKKIESKKDIFIKVLSNIRGPFNSVGRPNQGYLYEFNFDAAKILKEISGEDFPEELEKYMPDYQVLGVSNDMNLPKPFLLLAGISGTGKTRFVREQANPDESNYQLIPVRPDWHEPSDLLGYVSRLGSNGSEYIVTDVLKFIVKAWQAAFKSFANDELVLNGLDAIAPYWLCLDEMNLAPVEQYFADYLSVLETRKWVGTEYSCDALLKLDALAHVLKSDGMDKLRKHLCLEEAVYDELWSFFCQKGIPLPPNLIVAGTVNMDETTHGFSRKVLDRAFTIDFGEFYPNDYSFFLEPGKSPVHNKFGFPVLSQVTKEDLADVVADSDGQRSINFLTELNSVLKQTPFELAYRALNELLLAVVCFNPKDDPELFAVWDDFLMTKVLPRIEGDAEKLRSKSNSEITLLEELEAVLEKSLAGIWTATRPDLLRSNSAAVAEPVLQVNTRSKTKLKWMRDRLRSNEFTSFWP